ncbi:MAG: aldehyde dehydrogenase family protein [Solirubrobacterales bacterium]|nr:aldehyde dehydrogenase family protein [Solirubrobacterales bacterium]MBV9714650.1 aldehyde dehydrogenase family protein [Solirubrobacterales bacterium]
MSVTERAASSGNGGGANITIENPATGRPVATVPVRGSTELEEMARRARAAQPGWEAIGFDGRGRVLRRAQKWMLDNAERILRVVVSESGKTYEDAQLADLGYTVTALGFWAKEAPGYLADERVPSWNNPVIAGRKLIVRYAPVGLVGVIGPWNYPIANSFGDCIPALAAGNSVILKPSEVTPLSSLLMEEMMRECGLPEDVFQVATGDGSTGAALIGQVDCVMFTGSSRSGQAVMRAAAERLIPCYLELGGKDPMLVCHDADLERAANAAAYYSMNNAGQVCISVERVYVEAPVYDQFVAKVSENVRRLRQGEPVKVGAVDVGAVTSPPQLEIVDAHVRDAVEKGARVLVGGHPRPGPGRFYEPTVLVDVDHSMKIMREETFGPTLPIMRVDDVEEGIRLANDTEYGLQASVWTRDLVRGEALARRIEAGAVCVNDAQMNYSALNLPMGGWKASGLGTRHGAAGIRKYTKVQSLMLTRLAPRREPFMFPYRPWRTLMLRRMFRLFYGRGRRD